MMPASAIPAPVRPRGVLLASLAASLALHLAVLAAWPGPVQEPQTSAVRALDVELIRPKPLPAVPAVAQPRASALPHEVSAAAPAKHEEPRMASVIRKPEPDRIALAAPPESPVMTEPEWITQPPAAQKPEDRQSNRPGLPVAFVARADEPAVPPSYHAAYLRNPTPAYPLVARRNGEQGTVILKVRVTQTGAAASVGVDQTSGSSRLDHAAAETVRTWRFVPARQGTQPVAAWMLIPITFRLEDAS